MEEIQSRGAGLRQHWLAPALLPWSVSLTYLVAWPNFGTPFAKHLLLLMELEFVALHAGAFLGVIAMSQPGTRRLRVARWIGLLLFGALYTRAGWSIMGWTGFVEIFLVLLATYGGFLFGDRADYAGRVLEVGLRWIISLLLFMIIATLMDVPSGVDEWTEAPQVLGFGFLYFAALGVMELTRLYPLIRGLGGAYVP